MSDDIQPIRTPTGATKLRLGELCVMEMPRSGDAPVYAVSLDYAYGAVSLAFYLPNRGIEVADNPTSFLGAVLGGRIKELVQDHVNNHPEPYLELFGMGPEKADNQK